MTELELVWLAGLLEGEGSFGIYRNGGPNTKYIRPVITFGTTDFDVALRVHQLIEESSIGSRQLKSEKLFYEVRLHGEKAINFMKLIQPHMFGRRSVRIQEIIEKWNGHIYRSTYRRGARDIKLLFK